MARVREEPGLRFVQHPRYVNREFSWLQFNRRVLAEAKNAKNPLIERAKFLAIFESNLDEFFMVRVSGLMEQIETGITETTPDGLTTRDQLTMVFEAVRPLRNEASVAWSKEIEPALARAGVRFREFEKLSTASRRELEAHFQNVVFPLCTPLMMEPAIKFPFISGRSMNLAVELRDEGNTKWARVKVPPVVPRLVPVPGTKGEFVLLEDLIEAHLHYLFPGVQVVSTHRFRVIRDADVEIRELEAADLITEIERSLQLRRFGDPVALEIGPDCPLPLSNLLKSHLKLHEEEVFHIDGLLGLEALWELAAVPLPSLRFPAHAPFVHERLTRGVTLFEAVRHGDILLHHPYDSFRAVEELVASGVHDPAVIGIKMTLYRVGAESPIVESLLKAAETGKQVAAMVELKARFDESNNLIWSRALERAGVHVTYGFPLMKTHCKLCLVVRREPDRIRTYVHIGTGNYNPATARVYTDLGLMTCDPEVCQDVTELFNYLTGFSRQAQYRRLLVAPLNLREGILERIDREIAQHESTGDGHIMFKLNSLVDPEVIDALYQASQAGVTVDLVVRGACCLRPGVKRLSENIRVVSIVGRFLEHSRVYYFANGGDPEALIGSADMMRRNLDRRIEVLVPVRDPAQIAYLRDEVIGLSFTDTEKAWWMQPNGLYRRAPAPRGAAKVELHRLLCDRSATRLLLPVEPAPRS